MRFRSFAFLPEAQQQRGGCSEAQGMNETRGRLWCGVERGHAICRASAERSRMPVVPEFRVLPWLAARLTYLLHAAPSRQAIHCTLIPPRPCPLQSCAHRTPPFALCLRQHRQQQWPSRNRTRRGAFKARVCCHFRHQDHLSPCRLLLLPQNRLPRALPQSKAPFPASAPLPSRMPRYLARALAAIPPLPRPLQPRMLLFWRPRSC